jgi:glucan phosphoethanolaminetransferase (alkaline phosphatase superfamily)
MTSRSLPSRYTPRAYLLGYVLLLLSPNLVWLAQCDGRFFEHSIPYALMSGLLPAIVTITGIFGIFGRRLWIACLLLLPFFPLIPIEVAYIAHYREPTWYAIIATILESNSREAVDFLGAAIWPLLLACMLSTLYGVFAIAAVRRAGLTWLGRTRVWALMSSAAICVLFAVSAWRTPSGRASAGGVGSAPGHRLPAWTEDIEPSFPIGVPIRYMHFRSEWKAMRESSQRLATFRFGAHSTRPLAQRQIYVLVIGETGRRDRWQLYGYERPTNPELEKMPNLIRFTDMITPAGESRDSVPIIVSRKPAQDHSPFFSERSITAVFAEAGFDTYWLSNQMVVGQYDSPIAAVAYDAAHVSFYSVADWGKRGTYDEVLIKPLRAAIRDSSKNLFIVLHTMGSHANYANRYPPAFDIFKPSLKDVAEPDYYDLSLRERVRNSYDNSIVYTDHFIGEVIRTLASTHAVSTMWYVSDHGEDFASAACKLGGHGNGTVNDFRIPSVFWYSDAFAAVDADALAQTRIHSTMKLTTENIFESLVDMAGLDFPSHDRTRSIFSTQWREHPRIVTGFAQTDLDFDSAAVSAKCEIMLRRD